VRLLSASVLIMLAGCSTSPGDGGDDDSSSLLRTDGRAADAVAEIEQRVGASPAHITGAVVYPDYLIVEAQDPNILDHIDEYTWRDGAVEDTGPVQLSGPQADVDASLFPTSTIRWRDVPEIVGAAERELEAAEPLRIEEPEASYVSIERSTNPADDGRITITIYVSGPRRSGLAVAGVDGAIRSIQVY
jgi:hypothetical protein